MQNYSFQNVCNCFVGWKDKKRQRYYEKIKRIDVFFSKPNQFYVKSINNLPSHWDYIIKNAGKYLDWTDSWSLNTNQICQQQISGRTFFPKWDIEVIDKKKYKGKQTFGLHSIWLECDNCQE